MKWLFMLTMIVATAGCIPQTRHGTVLGKLQENPSPIGVHVDSRGMATLVQQPEERVVLIMLQGGKLLTVRNVDASVFIQIERGDRAEVRLWRWIWAATP